MSDVKAVLDAALDCVVMMDHEGLVVGINPAAERTFGIRDEDARGREMAEILIPPTMRDAHRHGLARYLAGGAPRVLDQRIEVTAQRADGSLVPVELTITRLDIDGPPLFVGYLRDIGDRIEAEEALRRSRMQLLRATFPAGTVTGTPKVRAMEIIDELEPEARGVYAGAVGYLGFQGNVDLAIAIRTGIVKDGQLHVQAAAGIVADSIPENEWRETQNKARALLAAAEQVHAGLDLAID